MINGFRNNLHPILLADLSHDLQAFFAQTLKRIRRSARLVSSAAKKLRSCARHALRHCKRLLPALDRAGASNNRQPGPANRGIRPRKTNHSVVFFDITAYQLVRLGDFDHFLHARHFLQRALLHLSLIPGDADRRALRSGHGMRAIAQLLDFFADASYLLFGSVRLHDN